jgi:outer membrane protein OmpA-like peptidoglycan-associated protein
MKTLHVLGLSLLLFAACSKTEKETTAEAEEDKMVLKEDEDMTGAAREKTNWDEVDVTSPIVKYDEVKSKDIEVRGSEKYSVYTIDESVLFEVNQATIGSKGQEKLKEVITSVKQRYPEGEIAVKGYTDETGDKSDNKALSKERAEAVADFLQQNGGIEEDQIEVIGRGEKDPAASNETAEGREQNRRVEIMVRS